MPPTAQYLAQSESKARFFDRLGLDESNKMHRHLYSLMKGEAVEGWTRMTANRKALIPQLSTDPTVEPPYTFGQIDEAAMHAEVMRIYHNARKDTRIMYELGRDRDDDHEENWIIRWLLWHVFRYRDDRNSSVGRRPEQTARPNTRSEESERTSDVADSRDSASVATVANTISRDIQNQGYDRTEDDITRTNSASPTRYWDPVRERFRS